MKWENDHQRFKKSPLNEIDIQTAPTHLVLIILILFMMICIMKGAKVHLAQNLSFCYAVTVNDYWSKNHTKAEATDTAFALGLTNSIRNISKKPSTQSYRKVLSFRYAMTENSAIKVIIDFFRKSYFQKD